jgi:hypothetical protein
MRSRRTLTFFAALCLTSHVALAQDRLFVQVVDGTPTGRNVEIGAIGRFGQPIGPAPADAFTHVFPRVQHFTVTPDTVVELRTGTTVFTAPPGETIAGWTAIPDATRVYVTTLTGGFGFSTIRAVDVASRRVVAEIASTGLVDALLWLPGDRVLAEPSSYTANHTYDVFDRDLRSLGRFSLSSSCGPSWFISPHTGRAYVHTVSGYSQNFLVPSLVAFDALAGRKVGEVNLSETLGLGFTSCYGTGVALWTAPGPPQRLAASVLGRDVTLSWLATDLAEGYVLDVGVAPGRTDLTYFVGTSTRVTFANAPTGTYHVRVRAGNAMGGGRPSAEIQIVVP